MLSRSAGFFFHPRPEIVCRTGENVKRNSFPRMVDNACSTGRKEGGGEFEVSGFQI